MAKKWSDLSREKKDKIIAAGGSKTEYKKAKKAGEGTTRQIVHSFPKSSPIASTPSPSPSSRLRLLALLGVRHLVPLGLYRLHKM